MKSLSILILSVLCQTNFVFASANKESAIYSLVNEAAKLLNSEAGITGLKKISMMEKSLGSSEDKAYLKSITHRHLLPKGHKAFVFVDTIVITNARHSTVAGVQVKSVNPLVLQWMSGKTKTIDSKGIIGSLALAPSSEWLRKVFAFALTPAAYADDAVNDLDRRLSFVLALVEKQYLEDRDPRKMPLEVQLKLAETAFQSFGLDAKVGCTKSWAEILVSQKNYKTYITSDGKAHGDLSCSKTPPNHTSLGAAMFNLYPDNQAEIDSTYRALAELDEKQQRMDEKCVVSDQKESVAELNQEWRALEEELQAGFKKESGLEKLPGEVTFSYRKCGLNFTSDEHFSLAEMTRIQKLAIAFCERSPLKSKYWKLLNKYDERREFLNSLNRGRFPLEVVAQALGKCCGDPKCQIKAAIKGGWNLDEPASVESSEEPSSSTVK